MDGLSGVSANSFPQTQTQSQVDSPSRRPGTEGHPGKHLGQMKHAGEQINSDTALPLVQQQLKAVNGDAGQSGKGSAKAGASGGQQSDAVSRMIAQDLQATNANVMDELKFTSRFNAISTAFST